jgi:hypothetical protein
MIEEKDTYTKEEVKHILANIIESRGYDSASLCKWSGVNVLTVDEWRSEVVKMIDNHYKYGVRGGMYQARTLLVNELEKMKDV